MKLDIDKLIHVPTDLSKLSNVVKKWYLYDKLVAKVNAIPLNNIDTSDSSLLKTKYDTDKSELKE